MATDPHQMQDGPMTIGADGIIRLSISSGTVVDAAIAKEWVAGASALSGGGRQLLLINMQELQGITREARIIFNEGPAFAVALLTKSPISRVIGSFFLGLNKPSYPLRLFTSEQEAVKWLKDFQD